MISYPGVPCEFEHERRVGCLNLNMDSIMCWRGYRGLRSNPALGDYAQGVKAVKGFQACVNPLIGTERWWCWSRGWP